MQPNAARSPPAVTVLPAYRQAVDTLLGGVGELTRLISLASWRERSHQCIACVHEQGLCLCVCVRLCAHTRWLFFHFAYDVSL
jgi:hypothetical protein